MGLRSRLLAVFEWIIVGAAEMVKAWIREVFRLCQQLVLAFSAVSSLFRTFYIRMESSLSSETPCLCVSTWKSMLPFLHLAHFPTVHPCICKFAPACAYNIMSQQNKDVHVTTGPYSDIKQRHLLRGAP